MTSSKLKIQLSQINTSVGDVEGNYQKIIDEFKKAEAAGCDLVVFCEMALSGYPCEDLWQKKYFLDEIKNKILEICKKTIGSKCAILFGAPHFAILRNKKEAIHNSAFLIENGEIKKIINKKTLPNYGVFDEKRNFEADNFLSLIEFRGMTLAVLICEDAWDSKNLFLLSEQVFDAIITINSSPYDVKKFARRLSAMQKFSTTLHKRLLIFENLLNFKV